MSVHALLVAPFETLGFMRAALVACLALALANGDRRHVAGAAANEPRRRRARPRGDARGGDRIPLCGPSPTWLSLGGLGERACGGGAGRADHRRGARGTTRGWWRSISSPCHSACVLVAWRGSNVDVMRVLFGTVLAIDRQALLQIAAASSVILLAVAALYRPLAVGAFDPAFLRAVGARGPVPGGVLGACRAGAGGELPGFRHTAGGRTDAAAGGGGAMLGAWASRHRWHWPPPLGCRLGLRACWFPIMAICPPARQSCWRPGCCSAFSLVGTASAAPSGTDGGEQFDTSISVASPAPRRSPLWRCCSPHPARAADRIPVVATFSVIGDMLANVGGDHIDIKTIVGAGGDSELYQPTAADVATVASARAVFLNDLNEEFEPWLEPLLKQAAFKGAKVVVTRGVHTLTAEEEHPVSGRQLPEAIDQHAWLDPRNGVDLCAQHRRRAGAARSRQRRRLPRARGRLHEANPGSR